MRRIEIQCKVCNKAEVKNRSLLIQYHIPTGYEYTGDKDEPDEAEETLVREYVCCEECLKVLMKEIYNDYQASVTVRYPYRVIADM